MTKRITFTVPCLPLPELAANARLDRWTKAKAVEDQWRVWMWRLREANAHTEEPFVVPVILAITLEGTGRRVDVPNWIAHGGIKVLVDCLCEPRGKRLYGIGLIRDDSCRYVLGMSVTVRPDGEPRTIVEVGPA